jgi:hypothetical protein
MLVFVAYRKWTETDISRVRNVDALTPPAKKSPRISSSRVSTHHICIFISMCGQTKPYVYSIHRLVRTYPTVQAPCRPEFPEQDEQGFQVPRAWSACPGASLSGHHPAMHASAIAVFRWHMPAYIWRCGYMKLDCLPRRHPCGTSLRPDRRSDACIWAMALVTTMIDACIAWYHRMRDPSIHYSLRTKGARVWCDEIATYCKYMWYWLPKKYIYGAIKFLH